MALWREVERADERECAGVRPRARHPSSQGLEQLRRELERAERKRLEAEERARLDQSLPLNHERT